MKGLGRKNYLIFFLNFKEINKKVTNIKVIHIVIH